MRKLSAVQGLVGNAAGWGPWAGVGMAAEDPALLQRLKRQGTLQCVVGYCPRSCHELSELLCAVCRPGACPTAGRPARAAGTFGISAAVPYCSRMACCYCGGAHQLANAAGRPKQGQGGPICWLPGQGFSMPSQ